MPENLIEATVRAIYDARGDRLEAQLTVSKQYRLPWEAFIRCYELALDRIQRDQRRGVAYLLGVVA